MENRDRDIRIMLNLYGPHMPEEFRNLLKDYLELIDWYDNVLQHLGNDLGPVLQDLMVKQYPIFRELTHPAQLKYMHEVCKYNAIGYAFQLRRLQKEQDEGVIPHEKYPKLEKWRAFYCQPQPPYTVDDTHRSPYRFADDAEWERYKEEENRVMRLHHFWKEKRRQEYHDAVQPFLFKCMPWLSDMDGDYWVLFAVEIRDLYEEWKVLCDELESAIDYELRPEAIALNNETFREELMGKIRENHRVGEAKRSARIDPEIEAMEREMS
ncbi:MAG: hypothetical protein ACKVOR_07945 [Flavobacteriales bacterium]